MPKAKAPSPRTRPPTDKPAGGWLYERNQPGERRDSFDASADLSDDTRAEISLEDKPKPPKPKKRDSTNAPQAHLLPGSFEPFQQPKRPQALTTVQREAISRLPEDAQASILGQDAEVFNQLLESGQFEQATRLLNRRLLQASVDLVSHAEAGVRKTNGRYGIHSFNGLATTIRELLIDLQAMQDRGAIGQTMAQETIRPAFLDIGVAVMQEYQTLYDDVKAIIDNVLSSNTDTATTRRNALAEFKQRQVDSRTRIGQLIQTRFYETREHIIASLQR